MIRRVEWDFLGTFGVQYPLVYEAGMVVDKAIEAGLEKLQQIDNVFKYKVVQESAQLSAVL